MPSRMWYWWIGIINLHLDEETRCFNIKSKSKSCIAFDRANYLPEAALNMEELSSDGKAFLSPLLSSWEGKSSCRKVGKSQHGGP